MMSAAPSADDDLLRVVVVRRGRAKPTEFRLRPGERGLSLFRKVDSPAGPMILDAVRAAGKQGELAVAEIPISVLRAVGLRIVSTPGGTPDPDVNAIHVEARPTLWRRTVLRLRGRSIPDWFNETVTPILAASAKVVDA